MRVEFSSLNAQRSAYPGWDGTGVIALDRVRRGKARDDIWVTAM